MQMRGVKHFVVRNKRIFENFSYVTVLQVFLLVAPLITYPYLVGVLGKELYGLVITAQVLASYGTIIINFGTDSVCAKYVSINRDNPQKLSQIFSNILVARSVLWFFCLLLYTAVVIVIPAYRKFFLLFALSYGMTFNEWLFPQYFFQGIENMKTSTIINILIKAFFICLVFVFVKDANDYIIVPVLYTLGYLLGGLFSLWYIVRKLGVGFARPEIKEMIFYLRESSPLFATDIICTVKDKLNYFIIGAVGPGNVVVYDLGVKLTSLLAKPVSIVSTVLFPRFAKTKNLKMLKYSLAAVFLLTLVLVVLVNVFLPIIVRFFLHDDIDLWPLRIFTLAPLFLSISSFVNHDMIIAFGYNKYAFYSIIVTTIGYLIALSIIFATHHMNSLYAFVILAVICYLIELLYRLYAGYKIMSKEKKT